MGKMRKCLYVAIVLAVVASVLLIAPALSNASEPDWSVVFDKPGSVSSFYASKSTTTVISDGDLGYARLYSEGGDSWLHCMIQGIDGPANPIMVMFYRTTDLPSFEVFVMGADGSQYAQETKYGPGEYVNDGQWHGAIIDMSANSAWMAGDVVALRFDYANQVGFIDIYLIATFPDVASAEAYINTVTPPTEASGTIVVNNTEFKETGSTDVIYSNVDEGCKIVVCARGITPSADKAVFSQDVSGDGIANVSGITDGEFTIHLVDANYKSISSADINVLNVVELTEYETAIRDSLILLEYRCYTPEYKALKSAYDEAKKAGEGSDIKNLVSALDAYRKSLANELEKAYELKLYHEESFNGDYDEDMWGMLLPQKSDGIVYEDGWYRLNWDYDSAGGLFGPEITWMEPMYELCVFEFDMKVNTADGAVCNGFGLKVGANNVLYGGGRNCDGDDIGNGISVDLYAFRGQNVISFGFNSGTGMSKSPLISIPHPEGFDVTQAHRYKVYDLGNVIIMFIDGEFFCRIELNGDGAVFTEAYAYDSTGAFVGYADRFSVQMEAGFTAYTRAGNTYLKDFKLSVAKVIIPEGEITPSPVPTATPAPTATAAPQEPASTATPAASEPEEKESNPIAIVIVIIAVSVLAIVGIVIFVIVKKKK